MTDHDFLRTARLGIRRATSVDAPFIHSLWTMPTVMQSVGFPQGLAITVDEIERGIVGSSESDFGSLLIVVHLETAQQIGQCKIGVPDSDRICEPDIKLHPEFWGNGYGRELWEAMLDYAFVNSSASIVQGTPNQANIASIRMQMGVGMVQVDEGVFLNHPSPHPGAVPVSYYKFQITRKQWLARRRASKEKKA